jgi:hypothetical protein
MCLIRLKEALGGGVKATILADRGFGDAKLFGFLGKLGFEGCRALSRRHLCDRRGWRNAPR